ncbi:hypothetical protein MASR1M32_35960 [Rhodobacter sp.]
MCEDRSAELQAQVALCEQAFAAATTPDDAAIALGYKAEALRLLDRLDEATDALHEALRLAPLNAWYWVELGNVRSDAEDPAGAVAHYSTAINLDPRNEYALLNRAEAWWKLNAPDRCVADSGPVLEDKPDDPWANLVQGRCLTALGRAEEGLAHLDRALAGDAASVPARLGRISALLALGRAEEALTAAEEALTDAAEDDAWVREELQMLALDAVSRSQSLEDTLAKADSLAADYPDNLTIPAVKTRVLTRAGRLDEAQTASAPLREAEAAGTSMRGAFHDALGQLDLARAETGAAARHFAMAMALDPALTRLYARTLSELGFLPLTASRHDVTQALRRCLDARDKDCRLGN